MSPSAAEHAESPDERLEPAGDVGRLDPIARALRLGSKATGCALTFSDSAERGALRARFETSETVFGLYGDAVGEVCAVQNALPAPLDRDQLESLSDVAALLSAGFSAREIIRTTDHVTGLPNRKRFERDFPRLTQAFGGKTCIMLVTLAEARRFNDILRALGHACAEAFVQQGAARVAGVTGQITIYHVSVLSFAFACDAADAETTARACLRAFAEPLSCDGLPVATKVGVGVVPVDARRSQAAETLRASLAAAQDSRTNERGFAFFDRLSDEAHRRSFRLLSDLREALRDYGQLSLAFQPRIDLRTGRTCGAEALARWTHPTLGPISPAEFVPLAETTALIQPLTEWVMLRACRQSAAWRRAGLDVKLSLNVSPTSLQDESFLSLVASAVEDAGAMPSALELEFTEGVLASSEAGVRKKIEAIRAAGLTVAIDDFGTGYANLDYLTRLPADVLKIDRSFLRDVDVDARRARLVRSMIEMGQDLGFRVVAEGVETAGAYDMLADWGCDEGQGYFMARPLSAADFAAFAAAR